MLVLVINFLLYFVPLILFVILDRKISLRVLLFMFVSLSAGASIYIWEYRIYEHFSRYLVNNNLEMFPFICIWILLIFLYLPIIRFIEDKIEYVYLPNGDNVNLFLSFSFAVSFFLIIVMCIYLVNDIPTGFGDIYREAKIRGGGPFPHYVHLLHTIYSILNVPLMLMFGYYVSFGSTTRLFLVLLFLSAFVPSILFGIGGASRGMIFLRFVDVVVIVLLFRRKIPNEILAVLKKILLFGAISVAFIFVAITSLRFGSGDIVIDVILQYLGESFLNSALHFWGNVHNHLMGERLFPDFFEFWNQTINVFDSKFYKHAYYTYITGAYTHHFKVLPIDFYIEFGPWGAIAGVVALTVLGLKYVNSSKTMRFGQLIWVVYYFQICFGSLFCFSKAGHDNLIRFIGLVLIYLFFSIDFDIFKKKAV